MEMSNFIDETERHTELYNKFTPRQRYIIEVADDLCNERRKNEYTREYLTSIGVRDAEIRWLKRTGRIQ